jgi:hypothetical protein
MKKLAANRPICGIPAPWFYLLLGLLLSPIFYFGSIFSFMGWFLKALIHEMGHCIVACFFGSMAFPAIRLDGHAMARSYDQSLWFACLIWFALIALVWHYRTVKGMLWVFATAAVMYPLLAFTSAREVLHLLSGHTTTLVFAAIFFWRALAGGIYQETERPLYAMIAWHLWTDEMILCGSLVSSAERREWYFNNGSFGLENDYVRVAGMFEWRLESVAAMMLVASVLIPLAGILAWWLTQEEQT